jgi:hypothetical protein
MSTASPTGASSYSATKGTVAALVLAGILVFVLFSLLLFYFFVFRPRKQRIRELRRERRERQRKVREAGLPLDSPSGYIIEPFSLDNPHPALFHNTDTSHDNGIRKSTNRWRSSERTGFARWKHEVEGGGLRLSGIDFRRSGSFKAKDLDSKSLETEEDEETEDEIEQARRRPRSNRSGSGRSLASRLTPSPGSTISRLMGMGGKGKQKKEPSETNSIPLPPASSNHDMPSPLSYMSSLSIPFSKEATLDHPASKVPSPVPPPPLPPPPPPIPASTVSPRESRPNHQRTGSSGFLLQFSDSDEADTQPQPPPQSLHTADPSIMSDDLGSVRYEFDDGRSILGVHTTQAAMRGLAPRTSNIRDYAMLQRSDGESSLHMEEDSISYPQSIPSMLPQIPPLSTLSSVPLPQPQLRVQAASPASGWKASQAPRLETLAHMRNDTDVQPDERGIFVDQSSRLPIPAELTTSQEKRSSGGGLKGSGGNERLSGSLNVRFSEDPSQQPASNVRSTPEPPRHGGETSFLDFSSSSDASLRTRPSDRSSSFSAGFSSAGRQLQSRWSSTTGPSMFQPSTLASGETDADFIGMSGSPSSNSNGSSANFPFPVSLPSSPHHPEGFKPDPPTVGNEDGAAADHDDQEEVRDAVSIAPSAQTSNQVSSPVDSVPMSVSELQFRHSTSEETMPDDGLSNRSSYLPRHPPLPGSVQELEVSTPSYVVGRVLGMSPTVATSFSQARAAQIAGGSRTVSPETPTMFRPRGTPSPNASSP